jgi:CRP-like cAMP-binding protein
MEPSTTRSRLERSVFQGLDPESLDRLAAIATPVDWAQGVTVFREGDSDAHLYLVDEGHVAIEVTVPGQGRTSILTVGPGEIFGWSSLFEARPKSAAARTIQPTRALALDAAQLRALCDADPRLGYDVTRRILDAVAERLKAARMQLLDMFRSPTAPDRYEADSARPG